MTSPFSSDPINFAGWGADSDAAIGLRDSVPNTVTTRAAISVTDSDVIADNLPTLVGSNAVTSSPGVDLQTERARVEDIGRNVAVSVYLIDAGSVVVEATVVDDDEAREPGIVVAINLPIGREVFRHSLGAFYTAFRAATVHLPFPVTATVNRAV